MKIINALTSLYISDFSKNATRKENGVEIKKRKTKKLYMVDGLSLSYGSSITTGKEQNFYLSKHDVDLIKGKKVCIIDDVISTGESLAGLTALVEKAGGLVYKKAFVLAEGDAKNRPDVIYLQSIPLL